MISVWTWLLYIQILLYIIITNVRCVKIYSVPRTFPTIRPGKKAAEVAKKSCLLIPQHGPCRAEIPMYRFDPSLLNCTLFTWGGCQGNGNRHDTYEDCMSYCVKPQDSGKSRPQWCGLTFDYGYCFGSVKRYYFDNLWKVCKSTIYSGCGGNKNNFYSKEQCEQVCLYGNGPINLFSTTQTTMLKKYLLINPHYQTSTTTARNSIKT